MGRRKGKAQIGGRGRITGVHHEEHKEHEDFPFVFLVFFVVKLAIT